MSLPPPDETRALAERVKELRQGLEEIEARIRELSVAPGERAIEPIDAPTVLTTNHAQRQTRRERAALVLGAGAAAGLVGLGIAIGAMLRAPAPGVATVAPAATEAPQAATSAARTEPAPTPLEPPAAPAAAPPPPASATATMAVAGPAAATPSAAPVAAPAAPDDRTARRKNDYGF